VATQYEVAAVQILSYKSVSTGWLQGEGDVKTSVDFFEHADKGELLVYLAPATEQHRVYIHFTHNTAVEEVEGIPRRALIKNIRGFSTHGESITGNVEIRLSRPGAAKNLRTKLGEMKQELYIQTLLRPLPHERVLLQMYVGDVIISSRSILDAEVLLTKDEKPSAASRKRILIRSLNGSCYYCQEVTCEDSRSELMRPLSGAEIVEMIDPWRLIVCECGAFTEGQSRIKFDFRALEQKFSNSLVKFTGQEKS
jgi:hypothetical protein